MNNLEIKYFNEEQGKNHFLNVAYCIVKFKIGFDEIYILVYNCKIDFWMKVKRNLIDKLLLQNKMSDKIKNTVKKWKEELKINFKNNYFWELSNIESVKLNIENIKKIKISVNIEEDEETNYYWVERITPFMKRVLKERYGDFENNNI